MKRVTALLYHDFTALDALGPLEVLGRLPGYESGMLLFLAARCLMRRVWW